MEIEIEINVKFKLIRLIDWNSIIDLAKFITRIWKLDEAFIYIFIRIGKEGREDGGW